MSAQPPIRNGRRPGRRTHARITISSLAIALGLLIGIPATAFAEPTFSVAWTHIGIYPRTAPSMLAGSAGPAVSDGTPLEVICEQEGESVTGDAGTSTIWEKTTIGWLPNVFVSTGVDGWTPGVPKCGGSSTPCKPSGGSAPVESPKEYTGIWITANDVSVKLINHYYDKTGTPVVIDWAYFTQDKYLVDALQALDMNLGYDTYGSKPWKDGDIYYALGHFTIARTSPHCYAIKDVYDFASISKDASDGSIDVQAENLPYALNWADVYLGSAKPFTVQSSGCIY